MSKPNIRPIQGQQRPLTEEEKKIQVMKFLQQKRETFALNILCNMIQGCVPKIDDNDTCVSFIGVSVNLAVDMADKLIEKLYPLPEEKPAE